MIDGNAHNPTGMTDVHLIKRAQTGKSGSAIHNMEILTQSYAKALKNPENQEKLRRLLAEAKDPSLA